MSKKAKIALGILAFIAIMVMAIVGAYFISLNNIKKGEGDSQSVSKDSEDSEDSEGSDDLEETQGSEPPMGTEIGTGESLVFEYNSEGDAPTTSTIIFDTSKNKVIVSALASSMYQVDYETTYSVENNQLTIDTATAIDATDISGLAPLIGLPTTLTADVVHTVTAAEGGLKLTILYNNETNLGDIVITDADLDKIVNSGSGLESAPAGETLVLEYKGEGDAPTTSTITFDPSKNKVIVSALASSMYQVDYETTYSVENNQLTIDTATAIDATDISGLAPLIGLPTTLTADVVHTVTAAEGGLQLTILYNNETNLGDFVIEEADLEKLSK